MTTVPHTLLAGSRKGLFVARRDASAAPWRIEALHFAGEPVTQVLADPRDGAWYAALRMGHFGVKLRKSTDRGASWSEITAPAFPVKPTDGPWADDPTPWSVDLIWSLAYGGADEPGVLWAGCLPAGLFRSADGGHTWALVDSLWLQDRRREWTGGGYDHAGIHSICVDPRDARTLRVAVSCGGVWQTGDGGATWALRASGMRATYMPEELAGEPNAQDPHAMVQCAGAPDVLWVQHHCGIWRSTDGAQSWQAIDAPAPSGFGFAVACDPANPARAWFVPAHSDAQRMAVDGALAVTRTDDGGRSFTALRAGLPQQHAYHLIYRHALDAGADGRTLAMGSTTGGLWTSGDAGESWQTLSADLPPLAVVRLA